MKIVVNRCFGGFGLSKEAEKWLLEKGSELVKLIEINDWYNADKNGIMKRGKKIKATEQLKKDLKSVWGPWLHDNKIVSVRIGDNRTHPDLIECVETLGEKSFGSGSKLVILEIPDDVNYDIDDYDGMETIHEIHRSW